MSTSELTGSAEKPKLPGFNCGICGFRTCAELSERLATRPELLQRCIHLSKNKIKSQPTADPTAARTAACQPSAATCGGCANSASDGSCGRPAVSGTELIYKDSLGRDFDFFLEHFPEDAGPREIIIPHNPMITRELAVKPGDILIGRPLGMSCGCPITHCGIVREVDSRTGVIVWCVTGPLNPRQKGYKDLGYYIAEGYEGLIHHTRVEVKIGARYYFQPHMCMLQWRHSGLVNYVSRGPQGLQVRLEGLWIG